MSIAEQYPAGNLEDSSHSAREPEKTSTREYELHHVETHDPYISDEVTFRRINDQLEILASMGLYGDSSIDIARKRKKIDRENPATATLITELPSFSDWLDLVPTAAALDSLYDPHKATLADGKPLDPKLSEWFCNIVDGRGIRSRAEVVRGIMMTETAALNDRAQWLSLASGAAQPVIKTAKLLTEQGTLTPAVTLVDVDANSLKLARKYADEAGIGHHLKTRRMNILQPRGIDRDERSYDTLESTGGRLSAAALSIRGLMGVVRDGNKLPRNFYDTVEVVGLTEYLLEGNWGKTKAERQRGKNTPELEDEKYVYDQVIEEKDKPFAGARDFLQNAYRLVKPGGSLIVGNMLDTHPQLGFTLNVIQWPHIQPRSIDEMMGIFDRAELDGKTDVYTTPDGAYAIYRITKGR